MVELLSAILKSIAQLKESHKEIFVLRVLNDLSFKEIAAIFNKNENWARVTFYRAKLKLQTILKDGDPL